VIPAAVEYHRASSLDDALAALGRPEAKALAGGQSLIPVMKLRIARPSVLVDLGGLELGGLELRDDELRIGALATWHDIAYSDTLDSPGLAGLAECAEGIGDIQVRNRGTIGGSLAHADPASDIPAILLVLGARVEIHSADGERTLPVSDLLTGPFTTALGDGELITAVVVPVPPPGTGSAYASVEHPASGFPLAGAGAVVRPDDTSAIAVTGVGAHPSLLPEDGSLDGLDVYGDRFAPETYRRHLTGVVAQRALALARIRSERSR
jgi:aerobic carbon-monoxide dehydrogenase medium subunit